MTFWLVMLTFFASVFFYALYPRDDKVALEKPIGEGAVASFIQQHQAAKNYMIQEMSPPPAESGGSNAFRVFPKANLIKLLPNKRLTQQNIGSDAALTNEDSSAGESFVSVLACVDPTDTTKLADTCDDLSLKYTITYGYQQGWWSQTVQTKEYWRTNISKLTYNSPECGTLIEADAIGNLYAVDQPHASLESVVTDTGSSKVQLAQTVPQAITSHLQSKGVDLEDILFCITRYKTPYDQNGLIIHLDSINNTGYGHITSPQVFTNLGTSTAYNGLLKGSFTFQGPLEENGANWLGGGLYLDGSNAYVDTTFPQSELTDVFTIAAVVKFENALAFKKGALWGGAGTTKPYLVGGAPDASGTALEFGFSTGNRLSAPMSLFQDKAGRFKTVSVVYVAHLSRTAGESWHVLLIDNQVVDASDLNLTITASDLSEKPIEVGRINEGGETFQGNLFNFKIYTQALATYACTKKIDEAGNVVCTGSKNVLDKRRAYQNFLIDRRRFGVGS